MLLTYNLAQMVTHVTFQPTALVEWKELDPSLLPGLDRDQYACLWVEHQDKGRLELNFVVPNVELLSGKRLQPYFDRADRPRIDAWKTVINAQLGLHDPDDPLNMRTLVTPRDLPFAKQDAAQAITDGLLLLAADGEMADRADVVATLEKHGFQEVGLTAQEVGLTAQVVRESVGSLSKQVLHLSGQVETLSQKLKP